MSNLQRQNGVQPGPCPIDPETGLPICPPPTEIDIIKVKKVFAECMHTQVETIIDDDFTSPNTTQAQTAECVAVTVSNVNHTIVSGNFVQVTFNLTVTSRVPLDNSSGFETHSETKTITKTLEVDRAGEEGLDVQVEIFPECLFCFISGRNPGTQAVTAVTCCVGILILLKVQAEVQLLVPTYGYPGQPPECGTVLGECPDSFTPTWPPYPEQTWGAGGDQGCCGK